MAELDSRSGHLDGSKISVVIVKEAESEGDSTGASRALILEWTV
jgi:hypothetical protein